jgi:hypothetical protein
MVLAAALVVIATVSTQSVSGKQQQQQQSFLERISYASGIGFSCLWRSWTFFFL